MKGIQGQGCNKKSKKKTQSKTPTVLIGVSKVGCEGLAGQ
jgi:hypothetical protein